MGNSPRRGYRYSSDGQQPEKLLSLRFLAGYHWWDLYGPAGPGAGAAAAGTGGCFAKVIASITSCVPSL